MKLLHHAFPKGLEVTEGLLGRHHDCPNKMLNIPDVSRRHCKIYKGVGGYWFVEDNGSLNGTFVNGTRVEVGEPFPLMHGDMLKVGCVQFMVSMDENER